MSNFQTGARRSTKTLRYKRASAAATWREDAQNLANEDVKANARAHSNAKLLNADEDGGDIASDGGGDQKGDGGGDEENGDKEFIS